nr:PP0621 family protein [Rhodoferax sp. U2-2l]
MILAVVLAGVWLWKNRRGQGEVNRSTPAAQPQEMVRCSQCGVHLPAKDAITGPHGSYCCADHRHPSES